MDVIWSKKSVYYEETDIQSSHLHQKPLFAMNVVFATSKTHDWLKSFSTSYIWLNSDTESFQGAEFLEYQSSNQNLSDEISKAFT